MRLLRWILVLPAALLAGLLTTFPVHWASLLLHKQNPGLLGWLSVQQIEQLGYSLTVPYAILITSAFVAPAYRAKTAIVVSVLLVMLIVALLLILSSNSAVAFSGPLWQRGATPFLWAVSIGFGIYKTRRADEW